jgi:hypothetical protein
LLLYQVAEEVKPLYVVAKYNEHLPYIQVIFGVHITELPYF